MKIILQFFNEMLYCSIFATRCIPLVHAKRARRPAARASRAIKRGYSVCTVSTVYILKLKCAQKKHILAIILILTKEIHVTFI